MSKLFFLTTILIALSAPVRAGGSDEDFESIADMLVDLKISNEELVQKLNNRVKELFDKEPETSETLPESVVRVFSDFHHPSMDPDNEEDWAQKLAAALQTAQGIYKEEIVQYQFDNYFASIDQPIKDFLIFNLMNKGEVSLVNVNTTVKNIIMQVITTTTTEVNTEAYNLFRNELNRVINQAIADVQSFFSFNFENTMEVTIASIEQTVFQESELTEEQIQNYVEKFVELNKAYTLDMREKYGDTEDSDVQYKMVAVLLNAYKKRQLTSLENEQALPETYVNFVVDTVKSIFTWVYEEENISKTVGKCNVLIKMAFYLVTEDESLTVQFALKPVLAAKKQRDGFRLEEADHTTTDGQFILMNMIDYLREFIDVNEITEDMLENNCYVNDEEMPLFIEKFGELLKADVRLVTKQDYISQAFIDVSFQKNPAVEELEAMYNFSLQAKYSNLDTITRENLSALQQQYLLALMQDYSQNINTELYPIDMTQFEGVIETFIIYHSHDLEVTFPELSEESLQNFANRISKLSNSIVNFIANMIREAKPELNTVLDNKQVLLKAGGVHCSIANIEKYRHHDELLESPTKMKVVV